MNDQTFWNDKAITNYFYSKPADPRIKIFLKKYLVARQKIKALDLGCGGGRHTELLARIGCDTFAVDINPEMINTTRNRLQKIGLVAEVKIGSITNIPYADQEFDIIVATGVLHQAESLKDYHSAVDELSRVLKPGGYALLNIFTNKVWDSSYTTVAKSDNVVRTAEGLMMALLSRDEFVRIMSNRGLSLYEEQSEDVKQENTGPRAVYRAFFVKNK